jgi:RNA polymerase sigma factor (sigma-70 family)
MDHPMDSVLPTLCDEKLVVLYRETNDQKYFEELDHRFRPILLNYLDARYGTRPGIDFEVVVSSTLQAFHLHCRSQQPLRPVQPWLFTGARLRANEAIRKEKCQKRGNGQVRHTKLTTGIPAEIETPAAQIERRDVAARVRERVASLPPKQREVVHLIYLEGYTLKDAAQCLGISLNTVKRRAHAGLDRLRKRIDQEIFCLS